MQLLILGDITAAVDFVNDQLGEEAASLVAEIRTFRTDALLAKLQAAEGADGVPPST